MASILQYKKRYECSFHKSAITSVAFNSCSTLLAASSLDGFVSVWEVNTGSFLHCINARSMVHSLVWSSGTEGFIFGCENGTLVSVFLYQVLFFSLLSQILSPITFPRRWSGAVTFTHILGQYAVYLLALMPRFLSLALLTKLQFGKGINLHVMVRQSRLWVVPKCWLPKCQSHGKCSKWYHDLRTSTLKVVVLSKSPL